VLVFLNQPNLWCYVTIVSIVAFPGFVVVAASATVLLAVAAVFAFRPASVVDTFLGPYNACMIPLTAQAYKERKPQLAKLLQQTQLQEQQT
jgi:hypothetical protein